MWVRASDLKTAREVDSPGGGANMIFIDPDGDRFHIQNVQAGGEAISNAIDQALEKWKDREIKWHDGDLDLTQDTLKTKLVVFAFVDDKDASKKVLKTLAHPWIGKDHDRMVFVMKTGREGDLAKQYQIATVPTLVYVAPGLKESDRLIEKKGGESSLRGIRAVQKKAFEKIKKASEASAK